jgi:hypothetical protein
MAMAQCCWAATAGCSSPGRTCLATCTHGTVDEPSINLTAHMASGACKYSTRCRHQTVTLLRVAPKQISCHPCTPPPASVGSQTTVNQSCSSFDQLGQVRLRWQACVLSRLQNFGEAVRCAGPPKHGQRQLHYACIPITDLL